MGGSLRRALGTALLVGGLGSAIGAVTVEGQLVRGVVLAVSDGQPIGDALLVLSDEQGAVVASAVSGPRGVFELRPAGADSVRLEVSHLGYREWETELFELEAGVALQIEVRLGVEAIPLEPMTVVAERAMTLGSLAGFRQRMADPSLAGYYLEAEAIARRPMATPTGLVTQFPGVSIALASSAAGPDRGVIMTSDCVARTYVDGVRVRQGGGASIDDFLPPDRIAGIEVYPRGVAAPIQYSDPAQPECGVVLFWTKPAEGDGDDGWSTGRIVAGAGLVLAIITLGFLR